MKLEKREVVVEESNYQLELTQDEVEFLTEVLAQIAGNPGSTDRYIGENMSKELTKAGFRFNVNGVGNKFKFLGTITSVSNNKSQ